MKTVYLFEDRGRQLCEESIEHNELPVQCLLESTLVGDDVYFSCGAFRIEEVVKEYVAHNKDVRVIVFLDVAPPNRSTFDLFDWLSKEFGEYDDVFIFPILCLEYFALKVIYDFGLLQETSSTLTDMCTKIMRDNDWQEICSLCDLNKRSTYVEKVLKKFVDKLVPVCKRNEIKEGHPNGSFWLSDCSNCSLCEADFSLKHKAALLLTYFPIIRKLDLNEISELSEFNVQVSTLSILDAYKEQIAFMNSVLKQFDFPLLSYNLYKVHTGTTLGVSL